METVTRKRIEILADAPLVPRIVSAIDAAGISGHTVLPVLAGRSSKGSWSEDRLSGAQSKLIVLTIASFERADALLESLAPILDSHGLLVTMDDVSVIRGERFS
jgi:PII-like signaling protein